MDVINVILQHREARIRQRGLDTERQPGAVPQLEVVPPALRRKYTVTFQPLAKSPTLAVREIKSDRVGGLVTVKGIITRVGEVRPLLQVGTFACEKCGCEVYQEVTSSAFLPVTDCPSEECTKLGSRGQLTLQSRGSRFCRFQEARIQEMTDQVPMGHIPRSMPVMFYGDELTRRVNPGDQVIVSAIYLPRPYTGFKAVKAGLLTDTYLMAQSVVHLMEQRSAMDTRLPHHQTDVLESLVNDPDRYTRLAKSIAPEIYGLEDVKRALLLMMIGGETKRMDDGMMIRGDINILLMGDPGTAKSQLLKYISKTAPRAVYTTGKGSSGVGLTAAVTKDPLTGEMVLEGGALVLADNGICAIDEFDKMDEQDRTAIHEVMEQQTISIAKAGITTSLNARCSVLAAANPLHGRYNVKRTIRENINLPPALLSRFDLVFLILDQADLDRDGTMAEHVCRVHQTGQSPSADAIPPAVLRAYVHMARRLEPKVPDQLVDYIVGAYVTLRMGDLDVKDRTYTTARTLLAILRLAQAHARLRLSESVSREDVDEAMRLHAVSRVSVERLDVDDSNSNGNRKRRIDQMTSDPSVKIYTLIKNLQTTGGSVNMDAVRDSVREAGYTDAQLQACLVALDDLWIVSDDGTKLTFIQ